MAQSDSHDQRGTAYPRRETELDRTADVDVDLDDNTLRVTATIVTTKTLALDELFTETPADVDADARLKTAKDPGFGWSGFEIRDGQLYRVNYQQLEGDGEGEYLEETVVEPIDVAEEITDCVEDDDVGFGFGDFKARRPGAGF